MPDPSGFVAEFKLSVTEALRSQLLRSLHSLEWADLSRENLDVLDRRGGVYQLALDGDPVYVGKSKDRLPDRLGNHLRKLSGRRDADATAEGSVLGRVRFRCVYVDEDLDAVAPEKMLMAALGAQSEAPWNTMGFGNKDPGKNRDRTLVKAGHFDRQFPIDLTVTADLRLVADATALGAVMESVKKALPYTYRFAKSPGLSAPVSTADLPESGAASAEAWFEALAALLPQGWLHVSLPGYVIAYPGLAEGDFGSRSGVWRSNGGSSSYVTHDPNFDAGDPTVEPDTAETDDEQDKDADVDGVADGG